MVLVLATVAACVVPRPSTAAGFTVTLTPNRSWCTPAPYGAFAVWTNDPSHFSFRCQGAFQLRGDPSGSATAGQQIWAQINAPPGITITGASAVGSIVNVGTGWAEDSFYLGGDTPWYSSSSLSDPQFASPYWAFRVYCSSSCSGAGETTLSSIALSATESQGPTLIATGAGNVWDQNRPGEWIWNSRGDPWPLTIAASDPSGVCSMSAIVGGSNEMQGPSSVPDASRWQQCPDPTWTPSGGASVDTGDYIARAGSLPLSIAATNAAGLTSSYSETLHVDNTPVGVSLTSPNDANPTVWVNHAVTVDATATAGPSGVGGTSCSANGGITYAARGVSVDGDGVHVVSCTASNNAVDPQGQPNTANQLTRGPYRRGTAVDHIRITEPERPHRRNG